MTAETRLTLTIVIQNKALNNGVKYQIIYQNKYYELSALLNNAANDLVSWQEKVGDSVYRGIVL